MPSIDNYGVVLLYFSNLPTRRFALSEDIDDLPSFLIPPYEYPSPYSKKCKPEQQKRDTDKSCDDANGKPCSYQTEKNPK